MLHLMFLYYLFIQVGKCAINFQNAYLPYSVSIFISVFLILLSYANFENVEIQIKTEYLYRKLLIFFETGITVSLSSRLWWYSFESSFSLKWIHVFMFFTQKLCLESVIESVIVSIVNYRGNSLRVKNMIDVSLIDSLMTSQTLEWYIAID